DPKTETQEGDRLIEEVAYQHWHRMLFARFLAENNLLMYPGTSPVPITLEECEELAANECATNGWELAARFAGLMLPQIFRKDSPVFKLQLPPEHEKRLETMIAELPQGVFNASDSLGWFYQFWQSKKKEDLKTAAIKIGACELPAYTQFFTEQYMVSFLLDNTLGAWWAGHRLRQLDPAVLIDEEADRRKAAVSGLPLHYLRYLRNETGGNSPASGVFEVWPRSLSELKVLDPCCGSGHFLVATFLMLVPMRMELEGLSAKDAVDRVILDNLHGLELDNRCVEIAAFALAMAAWRYPGAGGYRQLPELNLACSGQPLTSKREEWLSLSNECGLSSRTAEKLYELFGHAPVLGSLIAPDSLQGDDSTLSLSTTEFRRSLTKLLASEKDQERLERGVMAKGIAHAAALLSQKYHLVITNVPYLKRSKQNQIVRDFCDRNHNDSREDLATVFLDRCLSLCVPGGAASLVLPQNWLFLTSYKAFRERLLQENTWNMVVRLGPKAFQTPMWDFNVQLLTLTRGQTLSSGGGSTISGVDVSEVPTFDGKAVEICTAPIVRISQDKQLTNPDSAIQFEGTDASVRLSEYAYCYQGSGLADITRFRCYFWEVMNYAPDWVLHQSSPSGLTEYSGLKFITLWEDGKGDLARSPQVTIRGRKAWNKKGIACAWMGDLPVSLYGGWLFDNSAAVIVPYSEEHLPAIWCFCSSASFNDEVRRINQKLQVANATMVKVPFDLEHWAQVAVEKYPRGLPNPYSNDVTQWVFHGHPCASVAWSDDNKSLVQNEIRTDSTVLQIAVARLLGYKWPAELDSKLELSFEQRLVIQASRRLDEHADE
ncbi:MAG: N-6 DNA methylase, partial [Cyanobacteria bacterium]|nr:N-6 DNA methylase [Cyanobacteriota bacterium]